MSKEVNPYKALANNYPDILLNNTGQKLSDTQQNQILNLFQRENIFLELGSGSGSFLIENANLNPSNYYLGVEIRYKRAVKTAQKSIQKGINNLLIVRTDMDKIFEILPKDCIQGIYINFPDPWDKKRWLKHRMINDNNLKIFKKIIKENGFIQLKTDHLEYFHNAAKLIQDFFELTEYTEDLYSSSYIEKNIQTEFEQLFLSKNNKINYLRAIVQN